jgi:hypothetical protein
MKIKGVAAYRAVAPFDSGNANRVPRTLSEKRGGAASNRVAEPHPAFKMQGRGVALDL